MKSRLVFTLGFIIVIATLSACKKEGKGEGPGKAPAKSAPVGAQSEPVPHDLDTLDSSCKVDSDCTVHMEAYKTKEGSCCHSCGFKAINKKALSLHQQTCKKMSSKGCPAAKCAAPPKASCSLGKCTLPK